MNYKREQANQNIQNGNFSSALELLEELISDGESDAGIFHMAGQCCRYLNDIKISVYYHKKAVELDSEYPSFQLALGIAYQLNEQYQEAHDVLSNLILNNQKWDSIDLAFNSLALTQKKMGLFERAEKNYEQAIKILLFNMISSLSNSENNEILTIKSTTYDLWVEYAIESAIVFSQTFDDTIDSIAFPKTTKNEYKGLYWNVEEINSKKVLLFLPNFFATIRKNLILNPSYFNLIGNISSVLKELKNKPEAEKYLTEANELLSEYQSI